jgi:hypothetical protein
MENFRLTKVGGIKHILAHYNHLKAVGVASAILTYDVPQRNYQTGETETVTKYCVWRVGTEAVGSEDLGDDYESDKENLHNFSFSGIMYANPRIVKECGGFGRLVGLQEYVN